MSEPAIFISYRRKDSADFAARIRNYLVYAFGPGVFLDTETLYAGQDWMATIEKRIQRSDVVLALIGPLWLSIADAAGVPRLSDPGDPVRHELEFARQHDRKVIPVCIQHAAMPGAGQLPESLRWLPALNAQSISQDDFAFGMAQLTEALARHGVQPIPPQERSLPEPAAAPPGSYLPLPRNDVFTDREEALKAVANDLLYSQVNRPTAIIQPAALSGSGGIGKTQLAVELCYRYGQFFNAVHWLHADQEIDPQVAACGGKMDLKPWPDKLPEQVALTLQAWREKPHRLVVLDNLLDPAVLRRLPEVFAALCLLITSRRGEYDRTLGVRTHLLELLPRPDSLALLRKLAPRLAGCPDAELDPLASRLGDYPLALHLAGMYLRLVQTLTPGGYVQELAGAGKALSQKFLDEWKATNPTEYERNAGDAFALSWDQLKPEDATDALARRLFQACGYCAANTPIRAALFKRLAGEEIEELAVALALDRLQALGLVAPAEGGPLLHPLLAEFARLQDAAAAGSALPALANALGGAAYKANMSGLPAQFLPLRPHVQAAIEHCAAPYPKEAATLLNNLGYHQNAVADYAAAKASYERALKIRERVLAEDDPLIALTVNNLGLVLHDMGDYAAARAAYERALRIFEKELGPNHPNVATLVNNLGSVLQDMGDYAAARTAYERALRIDEAAFGPDHPDVARDVNNLGNVLQDMGDYPAARAAFERALRIDEAAFGPDHPNVASDVNNLGSVLQALGDYPAARAAYERALRIFEKELGPNHPNVATLVNNLGFVLQDMGDYPAARAAYERALRIDEAAFGPDHPDVARDVNNLGFVLQDMGDYPAARAAFERALRIFESVLGPDHPNTKIVRGNLASLPGK